MIEKWELPYIAGVAAGCLVEVAVIVSGILFDSPVLVVLGSIWLAYCLFTLIRMILS